MIETITVKAELLMELKSKQEWINKIPRHLPNKKYESEKFLWIDKNGNQFERGADFTIADEKNLFPCRIYRVQTISDVYNKCKSI